MVFIKIKWFGTASLAIESEKNKILIDPFVPLKKSSTPTTIESFDGFSKVLITHGHFDHIASIPEIIKRNNSVMVYCTKTPRDALKKRGVDEQLLTKIMPQDQIDFDDILVKVIKTKHADLEVSLLKFFFEKRSYKYLCNVPYLVKENAKWKENKETVCFEITSNGKKVLVLGSMNLDGGVVYGSGFDLLVLPYTGYKDNFSKAKEIIERLKPKKVMLDHFDESFPPVMKRTDLTEIEAYKNNVEIIVPSYDNWVEI